MPPNVIVLFSPESLRTYEYHCRFDAGSGRGIQRPIQRNP